MLLDLLPGSCLLAIQTDSNGFKRIQTDSNGYKRIQTDSNSNFPFEYVGNRFYSKTTEKITHTYLYKMYDSYRT